MAIPQPRLATVWSVLTVLVWLFGMHDHADASGRATMTMSNFLINKPQIPSLILISGCTGTGKSTFGMEVAIQKGILKCISTDTIRQTMRTFDNTPALHRSSFAGEGDVIAEWRECCSVLDAAIENIVMDCVRRGTSLVLEGVHIVPSKSLIDKWTAEGGFAVGAVLTIPDPDIHKKVIFRRGMQTGKGAEAQVNKFNRIRAIHDEMFRLGKVRFCAQSKVAHPSCASYLTPC